MSYDLNKLANLGHMKEMGSRVVTAIKPLSKAFKSAEVDSNNTIKFYTTADKSGDPVFSFNIGEEQLLDQSKTTFVDNFAFNSETYVGAEDPNLNGKPVLVFAFKGSDNGEETVKYVFANLEKLVKDYESADESIKIENRKVSVKISAESDNVLKLESDGLYVQKTDSAVAGAVENNIAAFDADGKIKDSGISIATDEEVKELLDSVGLTAATSTTTTTTPTTDDNDDNNG